MRIAVSSVTNECEGGEHKLPSKELLYYIHLADYNNSEIEKVISAPALGFEQEKEGANFAPS
jgi:hypothetical protein